MHMRQLFGVIAALSLLAFAAPAAHAQAGGLTWTLSSPSVTEGEPGTTAQLTFTVELSAVSNVNQTFTFRQLSSEGATGSCSTGVADHETVTPITRTILANTSPPRTTFSITVCGDDWDEQNDDITVEVDRTEGTAFPPGLVVNGTIIDDDTGGLSGPPFMSLTGVQVAEGNAGITQALFTVSLSEQSQQPATASLNILNLLDNATLAASCTAPQADVISTPVPVQIPAFTQSVQVAVGVCGDTRDEPNEGFHAQLANLINASCIVTDACLASGVILDEEGTYSLAPATVSVTEADTVTRTATVNLNLTGTNPSGTSVQVRTVDGTARGGTSCAAGIDYVRITTTPQIPQGSNSLPINVTICPDTLDEDDEQLSLEILNASGAVIGTPAAATITILDNDAVPTLSIANTAGFEEQSCSGQLCLPFNSLLFDVTLSSASGRTVTVDYRTRELLFGLPGSIAQGDATCSAGIDFVSTTGTLSFAPGTTTRSVLVRLCNENVDELAESFNVLLSNPVNATVTDGTATGTINNNDDPVLLVDDQAFSEGDIPGNVSLTVRVSHETNEQVSFTFATRNGTATSGSCTLSLRDYEATSGSSSIAANSSSTPVSVRVCGDQFVENNEGFFLDVALASGETDATLGDGTGAITILNDDRPLPSLP